MTVGYTYSAITKEYTGSVTLKKDPEENKDMLPGNTTTVQPSAAPVGKVMVFTPDPNPANYGLGVWSAIENHRGETWYDDSGVPQLVSFLGPIPAGWSLTPPSSQTYPEQITLQSPNGTPFVLTVANDGKVSSEPL